MLDRPSRAADQIWRLVSGYPPGKRESRVMVVLTDPQLVADASGNEPQSPIFVLAGFVAESGKWADFSGAWQTALDESPKLDYFKMTEAATMSGQFHPRRGWTEAKRDDRLVTLTRVIRDYAAVRVSAWIRRADYDKHILTLPAPVRHLGIDSPYVSMVGQLAMAVAVFGSQHGINTPCDYIFDEEAGFDEEVFLHWPMLKWILANSTRSDLANFVGERPIFRNDKAFLPLQAADLYAWQVRNHVRQNNQLPNQTIRFPPGLIIRMMDKIPIINREYGTEEILRLRQFLVDQGKLYRQAHPDVQMIGPHTDKKERQKAHKRSRKARQSAPNPFDLASLAKGLSS